MMQAAPFRVKQSFPRRPDRKPPHTYSATMPVAVEDLKAQRRGVESTARREH